MELSENILQNMLYKYTQFAHKLGWDASACNHDIVLYVDFIATFILGNLEQAGEQGRIREASAILESRDHSEGRAPGRVGGSV